MPEAAKEPPYITAARQQWELEKQASQEKMIRIVRGKIETYTPAPPAHDLGTTLALARELEEGVLIANAKIGDMIDGHGIFMGIWAPKDRQGHSLGKTFNLFAAPQDLTNDAGNRAMLTFNDAAARTAQVKDLCGHDGANFTSDRDLYEALGNGSYHGEWFIPTLDILAGMDLNRNRVRTDTLYKHKDTGAFAGSFTENTMTNADWYWSCTETSDNLYRVWNALFNDGRLDNNPKKNGFLLSTRLVRAELRP